MDRLLLIASLLVAFACREHSVDRAAAPSSPAPTATVASARAVTGPKLTPVDEAPRDPSLVAYRNELLAAVRRRDVNAVVAMADPNIRTSFGDTGGADEFRPMLGERALWQDLEQLLMHGGSFHGEGESQSFWAPYVYSAWPESHDPFEKFAVVAANVPLRESSDPASRVIATLSYDIVDRTDDPKRIHTADGKTGYVDAQYLRSPIGYRAGFMKTNGQWRMTALVAGD